MLTQNTTRQEPPLSKNKQQGLKRKKKKEKKWYGDRVRAIAGALQRHGSGMRTRSILLIPDFRDEVSRRSSSFEPEGTGISGNELTPTGDTRSSRIRYTNRLPDRCCPWSAEHTKRRSTTSALYKQRKSLWGSLLNCFELLSNTRFLHKNKKQTESRQDRRGSQRRTHATFICVGGGMNKKTANKWSKKRACCQTHQVPSTCRTGLLTGSSCPLNRMQRQRSHRTSEAEETAFLHLKSTMPQGMIQGPSRDCHQRISSQKCRHWNAGKVSRETAKEKLAVEQTLTSRAITAFKAILGGTMENWQWEGNKCIKQMPTGTMNRDPRENLRMQRTGHGQTRKGST